MAFVEEIPKGQTQRKSTPLLQGLVNVFRKPKPAEEPPEGKISFQKNQFVKTEGTGIQTNEQGEPFAEQNGPEVSFNEKLVGQYERFLSNYATKLAKLKEQTAPSPPNPPGTTMFEVVMANPAHEHDVKLFNELVGADGQPERAQIEKMLETPKGWMLTTALMDNQRAMAMVAMGIEAASHPNGAGMDMVEDHRVLLGTGQGRIHRWYSNLSHGDRNNINYLLTASASGGITGSFMGGPLGSAIGMIGAPLGLAASGAFANMFNRGGYIDVQQCSAALNVIKNNPEEAAYMKAMFDIDVDDFEAQGNGVARTNRYSESNGTPDAYNEMLQTMYTRQEFNRQLGIPENRTDITPEQFLYDAQSPGMNRSGEQTRTYLETRVQEVFSPNRGGILDAAGQAREVLVGGAWVENVAFTPNNLDNEGNLRRFMEARRKVINEMVDGMIRDELQHEADVKQANSVRAIDAKIKAREVGGDADIKAKEKLNAEKQQLTDANDSISGEVTNFEAYQQALDQLNQVREKIRLQVGITDIAGIDAELSSRTTLPEARLREIQAELEQAELAMNNLRAGGEGIDQLISLSSRELRDIIGIDAQLRKAGLTEVRLNQAALATLPFEEIVRRVNRANEQLNTVGWPPNLNADPTRRLNLYMTISESRARAANPNAFRVSPDARLATGMGLTENELRTMPVDQLITRINAGGGLTGIPVLDINNPAHRQAVEAVANETQTRFALRLRSLQETFVREQSERGTRNARAGAEKTALEQQVTQDRNELNQLRQEEINITQMRNLDAISRNVAENNWQNMSDSYDTLENWHTVYSAPPTSSNDLDPATIAALPIADLRARIIAANAANPAIALPTNPQEAQRFLINLKAEAQARQTLGTELTVNNPATLEIRGKGVTPKELRENSAERVIALINERSGAGWQNDETTRKYVQRAIKQARDRVDTRRRYVQQTLIEANASGVLELANSDVSFLQLNADYVTAERALRSHLDRLTIAYGMPVTNSADMTAIFNANRGRIGSLDNYEDITPLLNNVRGIFEGYDTALKALNEKREVAARSLNGATTLGQIDALLAQRSRISDDELRQMRTEYFDALQPFTEAAGSRSAQMQELSARMNTSFTEITAFGPPIDADALRNRPLSWIHREVNRINAANPALGWPAAQNNSPDVRLRIMSAISEARADIPAPSGELTAALVGGITENQVLSQSSTEIQTRMGGALTIAQIETMKQEVRDRMGRRQAGIQGSLDANTARMTVIDADLANPTARNQREIAQLKMAREMIVNRGENLAKMRNFVRRVAEMADVTPATGTTAGLSPAERTAAQPRGYYEILNLLFDYQSQPDRQDQFRELIKVLPPQTMADQIREAIPWVVAPPPPTRNITDVLGGLRTQIGTGRISAHELRSAVRRITNHYHGIAMAMAA